MESILVNIILLGVPAVLAITLHEAAHGYTARRFGDRTAEMLGRITLNPIKHIDPVGTILVPLGLYLMATLTSAPPLLFGWAKPVPVQPRNFKDPVRNMRWVSAAGPLSNLVMALGWAIVAKLAVQFPGLLGDGLMTMAKFGVWFNLLLMALNLLPILPLDGGRILYSFLPWKWAMNYARTEPYGLIIVVVLAISGVLWALMKPLMLAGAWLIRVFTGI
ncbi:MAG: site-2 protease family protein [Proteobacteria bacterium]|nr:site-2 protease family protein [Pseudomonadota bacterium]MCL2308384.1 site-2 protease family protein [Pseudomonadota bacterium]